MVMAQSSESLTCIENINISAFLRNQVKMCEADTWNGLSMFAGQCPQRIALMFVEQRIRRDARLRECRTQAGSENGQ